MPSSVTPGAAIMQWSTGSTSWERCRRRPGAALGVDGVLDAGAPGRDLALGDLVAGRGLDGAVPAGLLGGEAGEPGELFGDDGDLQPALGAGRDVLPVAAAAPAGAGEGAGRLDAVLGGGQHLDGVGAQEAGVLLALGDLGDDPLAGERVPDEEHLALVRAGDAVAAVRDGADLDLVVLADQRGGRCTRSVLRRRWCVRVRWCTSGKARGSGFGAR